MLMLWMFGCEVERQWGSRAFLRYYFVCGIGAGLVSCLTFYSSMTYGASGAIFGVMLAYAMVFPNRIVYFWWIFPMRAMTFVLLCAGIEMYSLLGLQDGVAHTAHLGGMLAGWLDLKRAWRVGNLYKDLKWRWRRRRLRVLDKDDRRYPFH
jgi:membrane associated rhomboid family serine protease